MVNLIILLVLGVIDIKKREIPIKVVVISCLIWILPLIINKNIRYGSLVVSILIILFSIATRQAFGLADSIVLSLLALKVGIFNMFLIFLAADVMLLIFSGLRLCMKRRDRNLPFIPFIATTYLLAMIFYRGTI